MRIAVMMPKGEFNSHALYAKNVLRELNHQGIDIEIFSMADGIPHQCDLVWDPSVGGASAPKSIFKECKSPIVATVHGASPFSIPLHEHFSNKFYAFKVSRRKRKAIREWKWFREKVSAIITNSDSSAREIVSFFDLPDSLVSPIHLGVNHGIFNQVGESYDHPKPYFLHVSSFQPHSLKKNQQRILDAYEALPDLGKPDLIAVLTRYKIEKTDVKGVKFIVDGVPIETLADLYRGAMGFVFPSLHEGFGLPILEAMACGCPVITSNTTACAEVAEDAALLVNPRSVEDISAAMRALSVDETLRMELIEKGRRRADQFDWEKTAKRHLTVFQKVLQS